MTFVVPPLLAEGAGAREGEGPVWLRGLPATVADLAERWALDVAAPFVPGGSASWVAPARDAAGRDLVLKVSFAHPEAEHEVEGLRTWAGRGAVPLHDAVRLPGTVALLLGRCRPGTPLGDLLPEPEQDVVVTALLARLQAAPAAGPFRPLRDMCDLWIAGFRRRLASAPPGALDPGIARAAVELFGTLPGTAEQQVLLCTDLHAGNVLADTNGGWLMIDPKPYVGDPCYDVLQHALNCNGRLATDPAGLADRLAGLAGLDADRVRRWLFARCAVEALGQPDCAAAARTLATLV